MRPIDADLVLGQIGCFTDRKNGNEHFFNGLETAKELIDNAPTIASLYVWTPCADGLPKPAPYSPDHIVDANKKIEQLKSQEQKIADKDAKIATLTETVEAMEDDWINFDMNLTEMTTRAEQAEAREKAAIEKIEYDYSIGCICNQCERGNDGSCHHTAAFFGCGFKYDGRGLPQEGEGV